RARNIVAPHIVRQRQVGIGRGAHPLRRELEAPDLRGAEMLDDLRASAARIAAVEDAAGGPAADPLGRVAPPLRAFAAHAVQLQRAVRHGEPIIERDPTPGDDRPGTVIELPARLVLVEAEMQEAADEVAGLRDAARDRPRYAAGDRVGRPGIVL